MRLKKRQSHHPEQPQLGKALSFHGQKQSEILRFAQNDMLGEFSSIPLNNRSEEG
jgi:hypothetical protein